VEVRSQLYVALDAGYIEEEQFNQLYALTAETARMIAGFMRYLATCDYRGTKFK
jgi:four helix bundle protein